ncbi:MAG: tRNA uridine-5-carboxymethylaminomethyl(34) synthesis GTPase MnmE [Verrucomicrobiales bacterium]|nr:tRNA uridine-5-carboxymethylaminomethyl(34) synthesis GTPase MnmE [Verrucomicrobiales bacterium]
MNFDTTIAAIATAPGTGAISLIRVSGSEAQNIVASVFKGKAKDDWRPRYQHLGHILDSGGRPVDNVLLTWFPGPASFTGEDTVEIAAHGGLVVTKRILELLLAAGAVPAEPGEFSKRSFFNGKMDLTQAEAIMDLISASTELAARAAQEQLSGRLGSELEKIRQMAIGLLAHVEAYIDFPDEDIDPDSSASLLERISEIRNAVGYLLATADQGKILREGLRTVICGSPNAGKSSLLNLLLGFERAIVTDEAGTTRDTIEEVINLNGIPIRLIDTAGIRENAGAIEQRGIERSKEQLSRAELILWVIDSSASADETASIAIPENSRVVQILNKSDLPIHSDWVSKEGLSVSCLEPEAGDLLRKYLHETLVRNGDINTSSLISINTRHQHCLKQASQFFEKAENNLAVKESPEFVAMDLREGLSAVGEVIGKTDVEEILGEIFSSFCIGK